MPDPLRFVMGGAIKELRDFDPTTTVLNYLRTAEARIGTKEGCAEGDCGACTVVLATLMDGRLRYRAVNSCILFLPTLDGRQLITVEDLRGADGSLHPVQRAMVEAHGSQCGFCTPGFVMSLFALYHNEPDPGRRAVDDALAGNLCRCTGYRPIVEAAAAMYRDRTPDRFDRDEARTISMLENIHPARSIAFRHEAADYHAPASLEDAARIIRDNPGARILAGGTDAGLWVTKEYQDIPALVYLGNVPELARVEEESGALVVGASVTLADLAGSVAAHYPDLGEILRRFGSEQVRNSATLAGNIANASPIGDTMPPLMALGATVKLRHGEATRELPLDEFFTGYRQTALEAGELIESVRIPIRPDSMFAAYKVSKRFDQDISAVLGAFRVDLEGLTVRDAGICYGGMAATPKRAAACEQVLKGEPWSEDTIERAARALDADYQPISDFRASREYRSLVAKNLLRKFYLESGRVEGGTRVLAFAGAEP